MVGKGKRKVRDGLAGRMDRVGLLTPPTPPEPPAVLGKSHAESGAKNFPRVFGASGASGGTDT
jgi:hypothetical protein